MVGVDVKGMTLAPAGDTGRGEGPRPGGRPSGPPRGWAKGGVWGGRGYVCREEGEGRPERGSDNQDQRRAAGSPALPGLGSGGGPCSPPHLLCTALDGAGISPARPTQPEKQLLLVPFSESQELLGVSLHCSPLCELSLGTLLL